MKDLFSFLMIIGGIIAIIVGIPMMANHGEKQDYNEHAIYIGDSIILNNDTIEVLEWRTGRYDNNRGYVLSNGMTVDELIVKQNIIKNENKDGRFLR